MKIVILCILSLFAVVGAAGAIGYRPTLARWGNEGVRSMLAIGVICLTAALIGIVPLAMASMFKPALIGQAALSGTLIRLLLTGGGLFAYQTAAQPQLSAFLFWAVVFYMLLLAVETGFGLYLTKRFYRTDSGNKGAMA
jgi:hypothetical protein